VLKVAVVTPLAVLRVPVPMVLLPSLKVTVPVGLPAPGETGATVAVNVTVLPEKDGFGVDASETVLAALLTVWFSSGLVLTVKLGSPL
jgi:hypothetical protein